EQQRMIEAGELTVDEFLNELEQFISYQVEHVDVSGLKVTVYPGYVVIDIEADGDVAEKALLAMKAIPGTIRARLLY
ncbi:hypothetical protein MJM43_28565, partial [Salmonella enterica subsp. enterica serovar Montevideo]|nr:hypothetical protein [Salmonella enterica subsp. enterica serovar Montevideo]